MVGLLKVPLGPQRRAGPGCLTSPYLFILCAEKFGTRSEITSQCVVYKYKFNGNSDNSTR